MKLPRSRFLKLLGLGLVGAGGTKAASPAVATSTLRLGILTDCQFADVDTPKTAPFAKRQYRLSKKKLAEAVEHLNKMKDLDRVLHLGDMIDKDVESFQVVMPIFKKLKAPAHQVLGNHDYDVVDAEKKNVLSHMGMAKPYHSIVQGKWRLIILDGNAVSIFAQPKDDPATAVARKIQADAKPKRLKDYNGGLGENQRAWLEAELKSARDEKQRAIIFCHYPLLPLGSLSLWDAEAVLEIVKRHADIIPAWFNGHHHDGNYTAAHGIHFLNFRGMVDTLENSYARLEITESMIKVTGYGREPSRELKLPAPDAAPESPTP